MKILSRILFTTAILLGATFASAQTATITGSVSNTATRSSLEGAHVSISGGATGGTSGFTVRAQYNYNDRFLNSYNANPAARIYDDDRKDGSLNVRNQFRKQAALFCDWTNALDQTVVRVQGKDRYRPQKIRYNGMRFNFGVSGNF